MQLEFVFETGPEFPEIEAFEDASPIPALFGRSLSTLARLALTLAPHRVGMGFEAVRSRRARPSPSRRRTIAKGMIWIPNHGDTAFTVPLFDEFMRRIMPGDDWRE